MCENVDNTIWKRCQEGKGFLKMQRMHKEMKEDIGMEKKKYSIKEDFSMLALLIIPVGVAVNINFEASNVS